MVFEKEIVTEHKTCGLIFSTTFDYTLITTLMH